MSRLREVRRRIQSVRNTQQVTRAMKMVAAAKLRRSQIAALQARPYYTCLEQMIHALIRSNRLPNNPLLHGGEGQCVHVVVITGDRGLCGGFNLNILKKADNLLRGLKEVELTLLGKKAIVHYKKFDYPVTRQQKDLDEMDPVQLSHELVYHVVHRFTSVPCARVIIVHAEFESIMNQPVIVKQLLPLRIPEHKKRTPLDTIFHPSMETVFDNLLPRYLLTMFHHALLESLAGVHGARMSSMDMATRNAGDLIGDLTMDYNRARQSTITRELIEIVSGAEALDH